MEGQQELANARQFKQDGQSARDRGNFTEAKKMLSDALNHYNNCLQQDNLPAYGPNNFVEIQGEKKEVERLLASL